MAEVDGLLLVSEVGGTARSGKGTAVELIAQAHPTFTSEERGADFRLLTRALIDFETIKPDMPSEVVVGKVALFEEDDLKEIIEKRDEVIAEFGFESLYESDVESLVSTVAQNQTARNAVTNAFKERVIDIRDSGEYEVLLVDGRNLGPVIEEIEGTRLIMRNFFTCLDSEAALRVAHKKGLDLNTEVGLEAFYDIVADIEQRNKTDRERAISPVVPDFDRINYWTNPGIYVQTIEAYMKQHDLTDWEEAVRKMFKPEDASHTGYPRIGAGALAARTGRQLYFDTTPFRTSDDFEKSKKAMVDAAETSLLEALDVVRSAASYAPVTYL